MPNDNGKERFKGEKEWDERNEGPGGGQLLGVKGARLDDHREKAKEIEERRRQSEQKNNPGGPRR
ncbi:MAG: hypothetical protein O7150_03845 [Wolbachia endosymbiont of Andrena praecox]|uniref:hypothetical protein n=1 Tax=unclassified Wolbachia TaxID=2640676 RepID=UPI002227FBF0|nr:MULTISPECIES: hypothetical protein [unclassified Wolbachia]MDX5487897.1 hypothetical protein [Wolbachia endosymbiont of Andrena praecox]